MALISLLNLSHASHVSGSWHTAASSERYFNDGYEAPKFMAFILPEHCRFDRNRVNNLIDHRSAVSIALSKFLTHLITRINLYKLIFFKI